MKNLHSVSLLLVLFGASSGCVWLSEEDVAAFNDRDNDGLDHQNDCDDSNKSIQGTARFYPDVDGDGFGDMDAQPSEYCPGEAPADMVQDNTDCDDNNPDALPGGVEVCDLQNFDEDCDGAADDADADATGKVVWFADADGDSFGDVNDPGTEACDPPTGTEVLDNTDCDDSLANVNPDGIEVCDPDDHDEDCDGGADDNDPEGDAGGRAQFYIDNDIDGYGSAQEGFFGCEQPGTQADNNQDCDDADTDVNPGAQEVCDEYDVDEDCDGLADDADPSTDPGTFFTWYPDADGDGFGDANALTPPLQCDISGNLLADSSDCDDTRNDVFPGAQEVCDVDYVDEDCDGLVNDLDTDAAQTDWYFDGDGDGFGEEGPPATTACLPPPNHVDQGGDCADGDPTIKPDAQEYRDTIDSNCDGEDFVCGEGFLKVGPAETFTTIQSAIDAVDQDPVNGYCDGDTIEVLPAGPPTYVYNENIVVADKSPNLVGVAGPTSTVIQGDGTTRVVGLDRTSARFSGFTVTGGALTIGDGGGIRVFYGDGTVLDNLVVTGNSAVNGGGIEIRNPTNVTLQNSTITGNDTSTGDGGGVRASAAGDAAAGLTLLSNLYVDQNVSGDNGGGIAIDFDFLSTTASVRVEDTVMDGNSAFFAGGMYAADVPVLTLERIDVIGNTANGNHGGVQITNSLPTLTDVTLQGNTGATVGGMQIQSYAGGPATITDLVALDNAVTDVNGNGHGVLLKGDSTYGSVLTRVEVARTARTPGTFFAWGGGLSIEGKVTADNLLIYDEAAPSGLFISESSDAVASDHVLTNVTVVGCDNDGVGVGASIGTISLVNLISAHNGGYGVNQAILNAGVQTSNTFANVDGDYNGQQHAGINGNIDTDPMFVDFSTLDPSDSWDLQLAVGSACIDTGTGTDADGSVADMGYYGGPSAP